MSYRQPTASLLSSQTAARQALQGSSHLTAGIIHLQRLPTQLIQDPHGDWGKKCAKAYQLPRSLTAGMIHLQRCFSQRACLEDPALRKQFQAATYDFRSSQVWYFGLLVKRNLSAFSLKGQLHHPSITSVIAHRLLFWIFQFFFHLCAEVFRTAALIYHWKWQ